MNGDEKEHVVRIFPFAALIFAFSHSPAFAEQGPFRDYPVVEVQGTAVEETAPDRVDIRLGVFAEKPTAAEATAELARQSSALMRDIEAAGVVRENVKTTSVDLAPLYAEERDPKQRLVERKLTGFRAATELVVTTNEVDRVGDLVTKLLSAHANRLEGVYFRVSDRSERADILLGAAVANARRRAQILAEGASMKIGALVELQVEPGAGVAFAAAPKARAMADAASMIAVRPGKERIEAHVRTIWRLTPK
jgi:hypothetical protein